MRTSLPTLFARFLIVAGVFVTGFLRLAAVESMPMKSELLSAYVKVADALAADDLRTAQTAAATLSEHAGMADQPQIANAPGRELPSSVATN